MPVLSSESLRNLWWPKLPFWRAVGLPPPRREKTYRQALREAKRDYLLRLLNRYRWNYCHVARVSGINRVSLYETLRRLDIKRPKPRRGFESRS